jgi:hypothetical protein
VQAWILCNNQDAAAGLKAYIDAVGIQVSIDTADMGRFSVQLFRLVDNDDLVFAASGINRMVMICLSISCQTLTFRSGILPGPRPTWTLARMPSTTVDFTSRVKIIRQAIQAGWRGCYDYRRLSPMLMMR